MWFHYIITYVQGSPQKPKERAKQNLKRSYWKGVVAYLAWLYMFSLFFFCKLFVYDISLHKIAKWSYYHLISYFSYLHRENLRKTKYCVCTADPPPPLHCFLWPDSPTYVRSFISPHWLTHLAFISFSLRPQDIIWSCELINYCRLLTFDRIYAPLKAIKPNSC
jgi:hypothetical protein